MREENNCCFAKIALVQWEKWINLEILKFFLTSYVQVQYYDFP